jgi:hypothetical protein
MLGSKTPDMVHQEFRAMSIAHFAVIQLMSEAVWAHKPDPDDSGFTAVRGAIKRKSTLVAVSPPRAVE